MKYLDSQYLNLDFNLFLVSRILGQGTSTDIDL